MNVKIKDLPKEERPRERLISKGADSLSNEELLSIILSSGTKNISVEELSKQILKKIQTINNLKTIELEDLKKIKGIGNVKAIQIIAIIELSKRLNQKIQSINNIKFTSPNIIYEYYKELINKDQEHVYCLYLNGNSKIIKEKLLFIGTVNTSLIHPRDIFKEAYKINATSIICIHNHPSGNINPSKDDELVTERLKQIGILMGIKLIDHIIIGRNNYYSFKENLKM